MYVIFKMNFEYMEERKKRNERKKKMKIEIVEKSM